MTQINLLHLSDLHFTDEMRDEWPSIEHDLCEDLGYIIDKSGGLDLVLFTGDLTQSGKSTEFAQVTAFLLRLWAHFRKLGHEPKFLAVPGNHDMTWPPRSDVRLLALTKLWRDPEVHGAFWKTADNDYRKLIDDAFANYRDWWDGLGSLRVHDLKDGCITGDFAATFTKDDVRLGIVGLNSAFLQLQGGMQAGSLDLSLKQFMHVTERKGTAWVRERNACLLMTHHPADWLAPESRNALEGEIHYPPESFVLHLFGHMHEAKLRAESIGGGTERRRLQAASLFSDEPWGDPPVRQRVCGYSMIGLAFEREGAALEIWPRKAEKIDAAWGIQVNNRDFRLKPGTESIGPTHVSLLAKSEAEREWAGRVPRPLAGHACAAFVGPTTFRGIHNLLAESLSRQDAQPTVSVRNIALDMEMTWALIRDEIMAKRWTPTLEWRSLMADGLAENIRGLQKSTGLISPKMAEAREIEMKEFCESKRDYIADNNVSFACRGYAELPFMHGFLLDDRELFIGLCAHDGKASTSSPYLHFTTDANAVGEAGSRMAREFIKIFASWFDTRWQSADVRQFWPPKS